MSVPNLILSAISLGVWLLLGKQERHSLLGGSQVPHLHVNGDPGQLPKSWSPSDGEHHASPSLGSAGTLS